MRKMLRKLIKLLPVSRGRYLKTLKDLNTVIDGLLEADANHCQIETNIIQQLQARLPSQSSTNSDQKATPKKSGNGNTNMYG